MIKVLEKKDLKNPSAKQDKNMIMLEIDSLTLAEALRKELWKDKNIVISAWNREHYSKNPILVVKTKSGSPLKALKDAVKRLQDINDSIVSEFKKTVK